VEAEQVDDAVSPPTRAQARIIAAALDLFARHGVGGTSLQMIANAVGVTKAAVYHQYKTKDEIVVAAAEAELARLQGVLAVAEAEPTPSRARERLVVGMVDRAIDVRHTASSILGDPVVVRFFGEHEPFRQVMQRMARVLQGDDTRREARVQTAVFMAAISGAVIHPLVADLDDDTLRDELLRLANRLLAPG
jgi:AcrR family transcriptional regulator